MSVAIVKNKASKSLEHNYAIAICDGCKAQCEASKLPGHKRLFGIEKTYDLAKAAGWSERITPDTRKRSRKYVSYVSIYCPSCAAKTDEGGAK